MPLESILPLGQEIIDHVVEGPLTDHGLVLLFGEFLDHLIGIDLRKRFHSLPRQKMIVGQLCLLTHSLQVSVECSELLLNFNQLHLRAGLLWFEVPVIILELGTD